MKLFGIKRTVNISELILGAKNYLENNYVSSSYSAGTVQYSSRDVTVSQTRPGYDSKAVSSILKNAEKFSSTLSSRLDSALDPTFTDMLISHIDNCGLKDSDIYKAAGIDRRLFSKIRSDREFKPSKDTALALIFALKLDLPQASELLSSAGYTLSHSSKRDVIIEYLIREHVSNLPDINIVLGNLEQKIIGR